MLAVSTMPSVGRSIDRRFLTWLNVLADPAASIVPSETAANGPHATGPPAARNPAEVVITTRALLNEK
jgi:hypothetical protein